MIKLVDRYVGRSALIGVLAVWAGLTLLVAMFTFLDELGGTEGAALREILVYVLLKSINGAYIVFPVAALLGAMIGVGGLAAGNELVAFRTAGASRLRLTGSVLAAVFLLSLIVMAVGEFVMPPAEQRAQSLEDTRLDASQGSSGGRNIWIRDGADFINIGRSIVYSDDEVTDVTLHEVIRYRFDDEARLAGVDRAKTAVHDGERWQLGNNIRLDIAPDAIDQRTTAEEPWAVSFEPELLTKSLVRPRYMSIRDILDQMDYLQRNGLDSRAYASVFWTKVLFPFSVLALVLAGMPFLFGSARTQNFGVRLFVGMSLGGVYMIVGKTLQNFSEAYDLPSVLGAGLPPLVLTVAVVLILRRSV